MKKITFLLMAISVSVICFSQSKSYIWAKTDNSQIKAPAPISTTTYKYFNLLAGSCTYGSAVDAENAFQSALVDQKRCHLVDDASSYSYPEVISRPDGSVYETGRYCYQIYGW